ncbi:hypothetical protein SAMN04489760_1032 [Syntrophus gentianae]|uniref:Uncharacterized protein n=1 Tax=Syntrophus gentianae TaxID=43775 RepID=A0A1H7V3X0_9BACT|nr:hypothetical protein SAMN04489760_1032 [Syntrophus gentianae]
MIVFLADAHNGNASVEINDAVFARVATQNPPPVAT